ASNRWRPCLSRSHARLRTSPTLSSPCRPDRNSFRSMRPMNKPDAAIKADRLLRQSAEAVHAHEIEALAAQDERPRPAQWRLSPQAVVTYLMGGNTRSGVEITAKYIGNRRLIETAVATLATDRAL